MNTADHDDHCEAEFILEAGGYTDCGCADRRGLTVNPTASTWTDRPAADIIDDITRIRVQYRERPTNVDRTLYDAVDRELARRARELRDHAVPRHPGPLALSAHDYDPTAESPWKNGTDPDIHDGRTQGRRPPKFIHTPNDGRRTRRFGPSSVSPRARARVGQIAKWVRRRVEQIARFFGGG